MATSNVILSHSWTPCYIYKSSGQTAKEQSKGAANCLEAWSSSRALFSRPMTQLGPAGLPPLPVRRAVSRGCRAQGLLPEVADFVAASASAMGLSLESLAPPSAVLAPLATMEEHAQWRIVAATLVTIWYLSAKPGPLHGLLDMMWAPVAERNTTSFLPANLTLGKQLGEGSFGVVFEGWIESPRGRKRVVLKKVKAKVAGAEEMVESELYFNQRLQRAARNSCADFLGTCQVDRGSQRGKLVEGTYLIWRYQGSSNLESFLRRRDFPAALAGPLLGERGVSVRADKADVLQRDCAVVQAVCRHILESLRAVHATGVVHRDVKPLNLVLDEDTLRFKLVDLGACVDLRTGYNYVPDETIMDPIYCAPEEYILPINTPNPPPGPLMSLLAPLLFMAHTPDKFDCFSTGLVVMQLAVPHLRYDRNLAQFNVALAASGYDLDRWRRTKLNFAETDLEILDANGGAAWDLARSLLRPRDGLWCGRPTAAQALRHRFLTNHLRWAVEPPPSPKASPTESKKKASRSGKKTPQPALTPSGKKTQQPALAPTLGFAWGARAGQNPAVHASVAKPEHQSHGLAAKSRSGPSKSGPKLVDAGAKFDRKVKLKATRRSVNGKPESQVAWGALLPLSMPFNARAQPAEAVPERAVAEPLSGLKRLMGLDAGALPSPVSPSNKEQTPAAEYPHVAALGQLLRATHMHQQVPVGLQSLSFGGKRSSEGPAKAAQQSSGGKRSEKAKGEEEKAVQSGLQLSTSGVVVAMQFAAASAVVAGSGVMATLFVKSSMASGYTMGQGLVQGMTAAAALLVMQRIASRLPLSSSSPVPRPAYSIDGLGSADAGSALINPGGLNPGHTTWLFDSTPGQDSSKKTPGGALDNSVVEMEAQLASLEATIRGGKECNAAQKALLSRVKALLLDASMRPPLGRAQVP